MLSTQHCYPLKSAHKGKQPFFFFFFNCCLISALKSVYVRRSGLNSIHCFIFFFRLCLHIGGIFTIRIREDHSGFSEAAFNKSGNKKKREKVCELLSPERKRPRRSRSAQPEGVRGLFENVPLLSETHVGGANTSSNADQPELRC